MKLKSLIIPLAAVVSLTFAGCNRAEEDMKNTEDIIEEDVIDNDNGTDMNDGTGTNETETDGTGTNNGMGTDDTGTGTDNGAGTGGTNQ